MFGVNCYESYIHKFSISVSFIDSQIVDKLIIWLFDQYWVRLKFNDRRVSDGYSDAVLQLAL